MAEVVRGVSLQIRQGEVVGLLGPNGAGKTTSFYMIVGLVRPDSGRILTDGADITRTPMYLRAREHRISYLPQEPSVFRNLSVEENILAVLETQHLTWEIPAQAYGKSYLPVESGTCAQKPVATRCQGASAVESETASISSGSEPAFILLDEPFSGIEAVAVLELQQIIFDLKASGIGVLITDHNVRETLSVTDRAYIINEGRILPDRNSRRAWARSRCKARVPRRGIFPGLAETPANIPVVPKGIPEFNLFLRLRGKLALSVLVAVAGGAGRPFQLLARYKPLLQPHLNVKLSQRQVLTPGLVQMVGVSWRWIQLELKDMIANRTGRQSGA